jgi:hypothetical protein
MGAKGIVVSGVRVVWLGLLGFGIYRVVEYGPVQISPLLAWLLLLVSVVVLVVPFLELRKAEVKAPSIAQAGSAIVAGAVLLFLGLALLWHFIGKGTEAPPASITNVTDSTQFDELLTYARRIPYEASAHGTADSALLTDTAGGVRLPVKAWIAPARGANFVSYGNLSGSGRGQGRVVARVTVDTTGGGVGYPLLNLPTGVSYVWVDSLTRQDTTGHFRALIIPDRPGGRVIRFPQTATFVYLRSHGAFANFPTARWVLQHSECVNPACSNGCCRVCPS